MQLTLVVKLCSVALIIVLTASADAFDLTQPPREEWPTYGGSFSNQRFSQLTEITRDNVQHLRVKWTFSIPDAGQSTTSLETTPLVMKGSEAGQPARDAVMFVTSPLNRVLALDATTGEQLWEAAAPLRHPLRLCCSSSNRGIAFGRVEAASNGFAPRLYMATLDARLWAFDAATGQPSAGFADGIGPLGSVTVADNNAGFSLTMAPLFIPRVHIPAEGLASGRDVVIVGISGAEFETRGFVTAYDAGTGDLLWRFFTIPAPGEVGGDTWPTIGASDPFADPFLRGGGPVWMTPAYDPATGRLFIAVGNPAPPLDGTHRAGDNLFTVSIVALDVRSGARVWHFQAVHHDLWDYDATSPPVLFEVNGTPAVGQAGKTGLFYILNRETGEPLFPCPETPVPASQVMAPDGTPEMASPTQPLCGSGLQFVPFARPGERGAIFTPPAMDVRGLRLIAPGGRGGSGWSPVALHAGLGLAFISGAVLPARFIAAPAAEPSPGEFSFGGIIVPSQRRKAGTFTAIDVTAGAQRWQNHTSVPLVGGALATSGGLVFYGEGARTEGAFIALDAETGGELFRFPTTGGVNAAPMTFVAQGKQLVTIAAGGNVLSLSSLDNLLITFELP
ncbi:MAG: pyrroloquinoline quinone-dependent dehydrogenase [Candidatus Entotheonellia bacterium]